MKKLLSYLKFENLSSEIKGYGFEYSFNKYLRSMLFAFALVIGFGWFYGLTFTYIGFLLILSLLLLPLIIIAQFKYMYNNKQYEDIINYSEQMIFAFKKEPKILSALRSTLEVTEGRIHELILKAIDIIENDVSGDNIYQKAFSLIENEYPCSRLFSLHRFLMNVERNGGEYQSSIDILLNDLRSWIQRTYNYQNELKSIKGKISLSMVLSLAIAGTMIAIVPEDLMTFKTTPIYQIPTTILLALILIIYTFVQTKLNGTWLVNDATHKEDKNIEKLMNYLDTYDKKAERKKALISSLIVSPILIVGFFLHNSNIMIAGVILIVLMQFKTGTRYKSSMKKIERELSKEFPQWLRDIALNLDTMIVPLAIQDSLDSTAPVLKPHLKKLLNEIEENPTSIVPYNNFLAGYNLSDLSSAMKMLYALQSLGAEDSKNQINDLVKRNQSMLETAERIQNEDTLSGIGFITGLPMVLASLKLVWDLALIMYQFMTMTNGI